MRETETCYLRYWSADGVTGPRERLAKAAAWIRQQQLEGWGYRVLVTDERGHAIVPEKCPSLH